jgi:hypothetical protein
MLVILHGVAGFVFVQERILQLVAHGERLARQQSLRLTLHPE